MGTLPVLDTSLPINQRQQNRGNQASVPICTTATTNPTATTKQQTHNDKLASRKPAHSYTGSSTALSSLSDFVTESLAPITKNHSQNQSESSRDASQHIAATTTTTIAPTTTPTLTTTPTITKTQNSPLTSERQASRSTSSLKSSAGTAINTTLAKAPPEALVQQPAWVFCTRYSDRPSSGKYYKLMSIDRNR